MTSDSTASRLSAAPNAFLILERGAARLSVHELRSGHVVTIGRAPSNTIIVPDAKCSRQHCEVFSRNRAWILRDLGSKNGVTVDGTLVRGDWPLRLGQRIEIGEHSLQFSQTDPRKDGEISEQLGGSSYVIVDRKAGTQFDRVVPISGATVSTKPFVDLIQLGRALNEASNVRDVVRCALEALIGSTTARTATVVFLREGSPDDLEVVGTWPDPPVDAEPYSKYLSQIVLSEREALLVHDVQSNPSLSQRKSLQELAVTSAICAPIRADDKVLGTLHLYAADSGEPLNSEHLEFALAVADQLGSILPTLRRHEAEVARLATSNSELREQLQLETELVGESEALARVKRSIARVARTDAIVLIRGESGVGKELVARAVHFNSDRRDGPFVCVNCAALTESLLESELFGHEKGAFTGAASQKPGKFEQANGGTLFLDEIGEMSPEIQAKFLRVLEGQPFERVGGGHAITVDVRVVTATNRNLEDAVRAGEFRQDLFYRLQVIEILVPPLREHPEDIPALANHFLKKFVRRSASRVTGFSRGAMDRLLAHHWPGNVRELRNVVERAVILSDHSTLMPEDLQLSTLQPQAGIKPQTSAAPGDGHETVLDSETMWRSYMERELSLDDIDRMYVEVVLDRLNWNKSQAARLLGIERTTLDRRLKKYGLRRPRRGS